MADTNTLVTFAREYNQAIAEGRLTSETTLMMYIATCLYEGRKANVNGAHVDILNHLTRGYTDEVSTPTTPRPIRTFREYMVEHLDDVELEK